MYKMFSEDDIYILPNGDVLSGSEMVASSDYKILTNPNMVVDVFGGILRSIKTLDDLILEYGILEYGIQETDISKILEQAEKIRLSNKAISSRSTLMVDAATKVAQITAQNFTDEQALEVKDIYPEYQVDHAYKQGDFFTHEGELYKVNQAHTSASQWEPGSVGTESLYTHLTLNEDGYPIWKQPTGAHDAYNKGDIVEYNGELYKSLIDGNAYSPDTYPAGWEKYTEPEA